jgi:hypothetical protein
VGGVRGEEDRGVDGVELVLAVLGAEVDELALLGDDGDVAAALELKGAGLGVDAVAGEVDLGAALDGGEGAGGAGGSVGGGR